MRNLTELTQTEASNTKRDKANLTPGEIAEIQDMQHRIHDNDEIDWGWDDEN